MSVWDETGVTMTFTHRPTGERIVVSGRLVPHRVWSFTELAMLTEAGEDLALHIQMKRVLDLEVVECNL